MSDHLEEEKQLNQCLNHIDEKINNFLQRLQQPGGGHTKPVERGYREHHIKNIESLRNARPDPYFGRVDFKPSVEGEGQKYYIGKLHIPIEYVYSWAAPVSALWYENPQNCTGYNALDRRVSGTITLQRSIEIENSILIDVRNLFLLKPPGVEVVLPTRELPLTKVLSKPKVGQMLDIAPTIQPDQYKAIAATPEQVMVIQGVAGSGKSEIGLHRIAYLLSPHRKIGSKISADRVVIFGPSKIFLKYIARVLPDLETYKVRQTTIQIWLRSLLSSKIRLERRDNFFEKVLTSKSRDLDDEIKVIRIKRSLHFARLMDKYVKTIRANYINNLADFTYRGRSFIAGSEVKKLTRSLDKQPLNKQRKQLLDRISKLLLDKLPSQKYEAIRNEVELQLDRFWPNLDYRDAYVGLLRNRNALLVASQGSITEYDADLLSRTVPIKTKTFKITDLPALCYLDHCLNERSRPGKKAKTIQSFEHVVIDEAQDISPLELLLIYRYSANKSFTILGDIGQRVLPHRGIERWYELKQIFSKERVYRWDARISYRSTYELTRYANKILKIIAPSLRPAIPYEQHGEKPQFVRSKNYAGMIKSIAEDIQALKTHKVETIAVLCKTPKESSIIYKRLTEMGRKDIKLLDRRASEPTGVVISSIYLAKGLEFDAVILVNARKKNYPESKIHYRLLYIAVTRAAKELHIHWYGTPTEVLAAPLSPTN